MNTSCDQIRERLTALAHGALSAEEASKIQEHLRTCPSCRDEHRSITELDAMLCVWEVDTEPSLRPAEEVAREILLKSTPTPPSSLRWWLAAGLAGAAAGFVFAMLIALEPTQEQAPPSTNLLVDFHPLLFSDLIIDGLSTEEGS
jgi:anti-sigma factor RsiW